MARLAKDGEVGLVYRIDGASYAVALNEEQHKLLQLIVPSLGTIKVLKKLRVDFVDEHGMPAELIDTN
ncbi:hypothetical protein [Dyadobacter sandarakinus]|uniref:Uncharacterized protein n=1 Tax=Dyadobacter sandarakinus TaxID=2747268 RepID=A0ABX7I1R7_9BACT|nr:hypothetical protein [Dyadobacter sandarakinus]QRQ99743.1 hypothetical protein HWI92_01825 [Dyadobacter sandarakinus]